VEVFKFDPQTCRPTSLSLVSTLIVLPTALIPCLSMCVWPRRF